MNSERLIDVVLLDNIAKDVIKEFPLKIEEYYNGKTGIVNMFMGEIKSRAQDKFEPRIANELLMKKLHAAVDRYKLAADGNAPLILFQHDLANNNE